MSAIYCGEKNSIKSDIVVKSESLNESFMSTTVLTSSHYVFFLSSELTSAQTRKTWKFLNLDLVDVTEVYFRFTVDLQTVNICVLAQGTK